MANKENVQITVRLLDHDYQLSCPASEQQTLLNAAGLLDAQMREVKSSGRVMGMERIAVLAGLNVGYELQKLRAGGGGSQGDMFAEGKLREIRERVDAALAQPAAPKADDKAAEDPPE